MAIYVFALLSISSYVAHTKLESSLKAGYFIVAGLLTVFLSVSVFT